MTKDSLVSVLMPAYNAERYISEAIQSILSQTYIHFELIIVDDFSTDKTWDIICQYVKKDSRIKAVQNKCNEKIVKTRNRCFALANKKSQYFAIMDSDDISMPERLSKQVDFFEKNPDFGIVGSNIQIINENSQVVGERYYKQSISKNSTELYIKSPFAQPSVMIRKAALGNQKYSDKFDVAEDWDLWFRILEKTKGANIDAILLKYRLTSSQSKSTKLRLALINSLKIRFKNMRIPLYFNPRILFRITCEFLLLMVPNSVTLWLFRQIEIKKKK